MAQLSRQELINLREDLRDLRFTIFNQRTLLVMGNQINQAQAQQMLDAENRVDDLIQEINNTMFSIITTDLNDVVNRLQASINDANLSMSQLDDINKILQQTNNIFRLAGEFINSIKNNQPANLSGIVTSIGSLTNNGGSTSTVFNITAPNNGTRFSIPVSVDVFGQASNNIPTVKITILEGSTVLASFNTENFRGRWQAIVTMKVAKKITIKAEGLNSSSGLVAGATDSITLEFVDAVTAPTGGISLAKPSASASFDLKNPVAFSGSLTGVSQVRLSRILGNEMFSLGNATISGSSWSHSFKFNTAGSCQVLVEGLDSSGRIVDKESVTFNLTSPALPNNFRVIGIENTSQAFRDEVVKIAERIDANPLFLLAVMSFETGGKFSPSIRNPASGATGLIQFMPATAKSLGTTTAALAGMSAVAQLAFVEKYFKQFKKPLKTLEDTYMAVLFPVAMGQGSSFVLFKKKSISYEQNKGLDINKDGFVTAGEATAKVRSRILS
jgi:hypothetical protein